MSLHEWVWGVKPPLCVWARTSFGVSIPMGIYNRLPQWFLDRELRIERKRRLK